MNLCCILVYNEAMSGNTKIILGVVAAVLILGAIELVGLNSQNTTNDGSTTTNSSPDLNAAQDKDVAATITYTGTGFEPNLATVAMNSMVRVRNRSVRVLNFLSDPYGQNTDEPELNLGGINPGDNKTFYVSQQGTWGYYNALDASQTGQLIVR